MNRKYFGTDGMRGQVGDAPMTPEFTLKLGWAVGRALASVPDARVLIGKDTRRSGYMLESALEAGLAAAGVEADLLGPLPTPGVAYLTRALRAQAGLVISASHNPHQDNGVKIFSAEGGKLSDALESEIEALLDTPMDCVPSSEMGRARRIDDAAGRYIEYCKSTFPSHSLRGLKLIVDCANGAAYKVAPAVFDELGAEVTAINNAPNGFNINAECGSTHMAGLQAAMQYHGADLGVALDGDADRCLLVTADGAVVDGDEILLIIARHRQQQGLLRGPVVGTQMSNLGLQQAIEAMGLEFHRAAVGDRYVMERLRETGGMLGGEGSGHILCLDISTTGDGIVTALQVLQAMRATGASLSELAGGMNKLPQVLVNVPVGRAAREIAKLPQVVDAAQQAQKSLNGQGRILLRPSGTEPLVRVMVEAPDHEQAQQLAEALAGQVRDISAAVQVH